MIKARKSKSVVAKRSCLLSPQVELVALAFNPLGTDIYKWSKEHPEVSSELFTSWVSEECVCVCFPAWGCRFGVKQDTTSFLCGILNRADALMCLYLVDQCVSSCHQGGV